MDGYEWGKIKFARNEYNNVEIAENKDGSYGEFTLQDGYKIINIKEFKL